MEGGAKEVTAELLAACTGDRGKEAHALRERVDFDRDLGARG